MAIGEHTLVALVLHQPGVLNRISGMFRRRGFNISSLTVGQSESEELARMTFVVQGDDATVEQVTKQLYKLVDVVRVTDLDEDNSIVREMALVKVSATNQNRSEIIQISEIFRSKIVDVGAETVVIEITGDQSKIDSVTLINSMLKKNIKFFELGPNWFRLVTHAGINEEDIEHVLIQFKDLFSKI